MQWGEQCMADNDYGTPRKTYYQLDSSKCITKGREYCKKPVNTEHMNYCGGGWANAVYHVQSEVPKSVQAGVPMPLMTPWKMPSRCWFAQKSDDNVYMRHCNEKTANQFMWTLKNKKMTTPSMPGKCLDRHGNGNIYMHKCNGAKNQNWFWVNGATLKSEASNQCVDYHLGNHNLFMHRCHGGQNQNFWWNDGAPIMINGGVKNKRKYLSSNFHGTKVDLWISQDRSGRQLWRLVKGYGDWYNIKITNGVSRSGVALERGYLSCTHNGKKVDIWKEDDESGRQRWKIVKRGAPTQKWESCR